jgi:hypothetical protein
MAFRPPDDDPPPSREKPCGELLWAPKSSTTAAYRSSSPRPRTPGQTKRSKRDYIILLARHHGFSYSYIAEVFGIARSRVQKIVKSFAEDSAADQEEGDE